MAGHGDASTTVSTRRRSPEQEAATLGGESSVALDRRVAAFQHSHEQQHIQHHGLSTARRPLTSFRGGPLQASAPQRRRVEMGEQAATLPFAGLAARLRSISARRAACRAARLGRCNGFRGELDSRRAARKREPHSRSARWQQQQPVSGQQLQLHDSARLRSQRLAARRRCLLHSAAFRPARGVPRP